MRATLIAVAVFHALNVYALATVIDASLSGRNFAPFYTPAFGAGLTALVLAFQLPWQRAVVAIAASVALSLVLGVNGVDVAGVYGTLIWSSYVVPLVALVERPLTRPARVASIAAAALLFLTLPTLLIDKGLLLRGYDPPGLPLAWAMFACELAFAAALLWAAKEKAFVRRAATPGASPIALVALLAGAALLAIAWLTGGALLFFPIWAIAFLLVAAAALAKLKRAPFLVAAALAVGALGFVPAGECTTRWYSDDGTSGEVEKPVRVIEVGGNGPRWSAGGGTGGSHTDCPALTNTLGMAWAGAFVALSAAALWRAGRSGASAAA